MKSKFFIAKNKGFQMTFENGNTISVMFGAGNYCSNRKESTSTEIESSHDAEICIWNEKNEDYIFKNDGGGICNGWCSTDDVAKWVDFASKTVF